MSRFMVYILLFARMPLVFFLRLVYSAGGFSLKLGMKFTGGSGAVLVAYLLVYAVGTPFFSWNDTLDRIWVGLAFIITLVPVLYLTEILVEAFNQNAKNRYPDDSVTWQSVGFMTVLVSLVVCAMGLYGGASDPRSTGSSTDISFWSIGVAGLFTGIGICFWALVNDPETQRHLNKRD